MPCPHSRGKEIIYWFSHGPLFSRWTVNQLGRSLRAVITRWNYIYESFFVIRLELHYISQCTTKGCGQFSQGWQNSRNSSDRCQSYPAQSRRVQRCRGWPTNNIFWQGTNGKQRRSGLLTPGGATALWASSPTSAQNLSPQPHDPCQILVWVKEWVSYWKGSGFDVQWSSCLGWGIQSRVAVYWLLPTQRPGQDSPSTYNHQLRLVAVKWVSVINNNGWSIRCTVTVAKLSRPRGCGKRTEK
jgi:hypothetical protein